METTSVKAVGKSKNCNPLESLKIDSGAVSSGGSSRPKVNKRNASLLMENGDPSSQKLSTAEEIFSSTPTIVVALGDENGTQALKMQTMNLSNSTSRNKTSNDVQSLYDEEDGVADQNLVSFPFCRCDVRCFYQCFFSFHKFLLTSSRLIFMSLCWKRKPDNSVLIL